MAYYDVDDPEAVAAAAAAIGVAGSLLLESDEDLTRNITPSGVNAIDQAVNQAVAATETSASNTQSNTPSEQTAAQTENQSGRSTVSSDSSSSMPHLHLSERFLLELYTAPNQEEQRRKERDRQQRQVSV